MSAPAGKEAPAATAAWPTDTYFDEFHKLPEYFNGEAVIVYHAPAANTDGDSFVFFRHSEVISAGNLFSTVSYPVIDVDKGGTIQGVIDGLNQILDLAVAEYRAQGGTWIVPGRGRLSDTADVASYRNMLTMIRDRVQDLIDKGMTLEQVKAARPTMDFDGRYGSTTGSVDDGHVRRGGVSEPSGEEVMRKSQVALVIACTLVAGTAAYAHHSYGATYDVNKEIKLEGKLVQFVYRNPHSFVHIEAPDENGVEQRWAVEWSGGGQLAKQGVTRESLKVGDEVIIIGRPSRVPGEYRALMVKPDASVRWVHLGVAGQVLSR